MPRIFYVYLPVLLRLEIRIFLRVPRIWQSLPFFLSRVCCRVLANWTLLEMTMSMNASGRISHISHVKYALSALGI